MIFFSVLVAKQFNQKDSGKMNSNETTQAGFHNAIKRIPTTINAIEVTQAGFQPYIFGPIFWRFLHTWTLSFPVSSPTHAEQAAALNFLEAFAATLGCQTCKQHLLEYLKQVPPDVTSRACLFAWTIDFHNAVNIRLHKPVQSLDWAVKHYTTMMSSESCLQQRTVSDWHYTIVLCILLIFLLSRILMKSPANQR